MTDHWLWRLSPREWMEAAERELELGRDQIGSRRTAVTHARRAAGMALNGALVAMATRGWSRERCEIEWGRSYIDHLRVLAARASDANELRDDPFDRAQFERCRTLLAISVMPPTGLVPLATRKDQAAAQAIDLADAICHACRALLPASGAPAN